MLQKTLSSTGSTSLRMVMVIHSHSRSLHSHASSPSSFDVSCIIPHVSHQGKGCSETRLGQFEYTLAGKELQHFVMESSLQVSSVVLTLLCLNASDNNISLSLCLCLSLDERCIFSCSTWDPRQPGGVIVHYTFCGRKSNHHCFIFYHGYHSIEPLFYSRFVVFTHPSSRRLHPSFISSYSETRLRLRLSMTSFQTRHVSIVFVSTERWPSRPLCRSSVTCSTAVMFSRIETSRLFSRWCKMAFLKWRCSSSFLSWSCLWLSLCFMLSMCRMTRMSSRQRKLKGDYDYFVIYFFLFVFLWCVCENSNVGHSYENS